MRDLFHRCAIPLCDQYLHQPSVSAGLMLADVRSRDGCPQAWRKSASPGTVPGATARLRTLRIAACFLAPLSATQFPLSATAEDAIAASASLTSNPLPIASYAAFVTEASRRFAIPAHWIRAVIQVESAGNAQAISPRGALGLMQIMPETWVELSVRYDLGIDPLDPRDNILAGTAYLREMLDRFGPEGFLAAYNAGPRRYEEHLATGRPLPADTQAYVAAVASLSKI